MDEKFLLIVFKINRFVVRLTPFSLEAIKNRSDGIIEEAADILLENLDRRLPLSEELIAAAILDPSIQHLGVVDNWLESHDTTR